MLLTAGGGLLLGAIAAALSVVSTRKQAAWLRPEPAAAYRMEATLWAAYLGLAALIYVGFALREAGEGWMHVELGGLAAYGVLGLIGARGRMWLVGLGWALHAAWDLVVHAGVADEFVPRWYRWACVSFDLIVAVYLLRRRGDPAG